MLFNFIVVLLWLSANGNPRQGFFFRRSWRCYCQVGSYRNRNDVWYVMPFDSKLSLAKSLHIFNKMKNIVLLMNFLLLLRSFRMLPDMKYSQSNKNQKVILFPNIHILRLSCRLGHCTVRTKSQGRAYRNTITRKIFLPFRSKEVTKTKHIEDDHGNTPTTGAWWF